jgi:tetratricopeptide (TPR) repeat protein
MAGNSRGRILTLVLLFCLCAPILAKTPTPTPRPKSKAPSPAQKDSRQDDSINLAPAKDLLLQNTGRLKSDALTEFVRGAAFEENGEMDKALEAYRHVLNVDPGQADLAARMAALLTRQNDYPAAIDILKDAIKANPKAAEPYLQLAFIYSNYLKKPDQAVEYANRAIGLEPANIDTYARLYEIYSSAGDEPKALQTIERARSIKTDDPVFWIRLGKLFAGIVFKAGVEPAPQDIAKVNDLFKKAADRAQDDPAILKDVADYYAASQQIREAIPIYLRVLELQPEDSNAREKLATGFVMTNQRSKAIEMLDEIIKEHPEKYQPYDLLAQVLEDQGRALQRENKPNEAKTVYTKAVANYEQSLLVNPGHAITYIRLAQLLLGSVKDPERAVTILTEARRRFPEAPEMVYYLAIALREAKHAQQAVTTFEEALHESELDSGEMVNAQFYSDYGAAAEQAGLYDKAADLLKKAISLDPANSAEACNYLAYMWAEQNTHLDEAADLIKRALETDPNNGAFLDTKGWMEYRQGKLDQALDDLRRAADLIGHEDPVVFTHIGDTYLKLKKLPEAVDAWQKAVTLDPKNKELSGKIDAAKKEIAKSGAANHNTSH